MKEDASGEQPTRKVESPKPTDDAEYTDYYNGLRKKIKKWT